MAFTFFQKRKKEKYLILILSLLILAILIILWQGFSVKPELLLVREFPKPEEVEINFEILENPILQSLQPFEKIPLFEGEIDPERNPFVPYAEL